MTEAKAKSMGKAVGSGATAESVPAAGQAREPATESRLTRQMGAMMRAVFVPPVRTPLIILTLSIFVIVLLTAYGQILLNQWNKPFYDALSRRDLHDFLFQLGVFCVLAVLNLVLNVGQRWLVETSKIRLREGLVQDLLRDWMKPRRAFWLANTGGQMGVNPDQRMHEDARKLCELTADLSVGLLQSAVLFVSFAGVLWLLSKDFVFRFGDTDYGVPGFMLWAAILYAMFGSLASYWVGSSLVARNADRYAREADLRFSLVRINEHLDGISLASGESDEKRRVELHLANVLTATRRLVRGLTNLTWITSGFGWITIVAPILVASPIYFAGKISFGGLMMAASAFTQAQSSLKWFVDNFSVLADWRATLLRVASFREALTSGEEEHQDFDSRITYEDGPPGSMTVEGLEIAASTGCDMLKEKKVVISHGERVLIVGAPGTGKTLLFRALAGLWPWGAGTVTRPKGEQFLYIPRGTPYLPRGTLREVLAYPQKVETFQEASFANALHRLGLERLIALLDTTRRWDQELTQEEQLALAFARVVVQAPPWVLIDDTFGTLDDDALERVLSVFTNELSQTAVIHIGRSTQARDPFFSTVLHLIKDPVLQKHIEETTPEQGGRKTSAVAQQ
ncbi:MAG TPA: ABC transporter ATP-binding protein/permease [Steroidobacteraceae bacterium]|jgi:putative ATP-binding cassette transporter